MSGEEEAYSRILREEALVTDGELRLELARVLDRSIAGGEDVLLYGKFAQFRCDLQISRLSRTTVVNGAYDRHSHKTELFKLTGSVSETIDGPVVQMAQVESESIVGGSYVGLWVGPHVRTAAYCDFLAWGGWASVDTTRIEIGGLSIRSYMGFVGAVGLRMFRATSLIDDWIMRTENFGTFVDNQTESTFLGAPGAGTQLHT
ncbi:MAG: hypothetical protein OXH27_04560 [Gammaproteobacteria bacterium]|nr:hypothetical protein [Gammaproteobacteria bacterium]MCY3688342.1 hypothetical protein [Gammaproteobacteria bacterium]MDE0478047.1 hypothetical protein [Gammaproteobacteria bacterium]MDE0507493.1 hypothetical protein [Gammaproteobacteria bacterium]MXX06734.1 hypothetical protein [Gammaproteobacteria bacterium]